MTGDRSAAWGLVAILIVACSASDGAPEPNGNAGAGGDGTGGGVAAGSGGMGGSTGATGGAAGAAAGAGTGGSAGASGGSAGASGGAAGASVGAGGNPSITFSWPETQPGTGVCKAGHYVGTFNGTFSSSLTVFPLPLKVAGNVDMTLDQSQNGEFFNISNGHVSGVANGTYPYSCDIVGGLNCVTAKLENTNLTNCTYTAFGIKKPFAGPLTANYDKLTFAFVGGTWVGKEPVAPYGGKGTWNAKFTP